MLVLSTAAAGAAPQGQQILLQVGDNVPQFGPIERIEAVRVADNGLVLTDGRLDTIGSLNDDLLLRDRLAMLVEGTAVPMPVGATISSWIVHSTNARGQLGMAINLNDTSGNLDDSGIYWNLELLLQEGDTVDDPAHPELADEIYVRFNGLVLNDQDDLLVLANFDESPPVQPSKDALVLIRTDGAGLKQSETLLVAEGAVFPDIPGSTVRAISSTPQSLAFNGRGDWMTAAQSTDGNTSTWHILKNGEPIASEGSSAPFPNRTYAGLINSEMSLNSSGEHAFNGQLDDCSGSCPNLVDFIVKDGQPFVAAGEMLASIEPSVIGDLASAPVLLDDGGNLFWYAALNGPAASENEIYFRNRDIVIEEGVTIVEGRLVVRLEDDNTAFHVSPSGRFLAARVGLGGIGDAVVLVDFGSLVPIPGCQGNPSRLTVSEGLALAGSELEFAMDPAQGSGALPFLLFSTRQAIPGSPCGVVSPWGELLIGIKAAQVVGTLIGTPWLPGTPSVVRLDLPPDPSLVDLVVYGQGYFLDSTPPSGAPKIQITNGLRMEIGAP